MTATQRRIGSRDVELGNLDKTLFPAGGVTKGDVIAYYERIAVHMLPHVAGRPLVLERFPDGIEQEGFFQKNAPGYLPDWIARVDVPTSSDGTTSYPVIHDAAGLVYLANQGTIAFHTLLANADAPDRPVEVVFDLDPSGDDLAPLRRTAARLHEILDDLGLAPRVKSSGSKGLHVVVDVRDASADFALTRSFATRVARLVARDDPEVTLEQRRDRRRGRLYLDVLRNARANHAVAPYSLRALPEAPVAAPLDWAEAVRAAFDPRRLTIRNTFRRLGHKPDPWQDPRPATARIADAVRTLPDPPPERH